MYYNKILKKSYIRVLAWIIILILLIFILTSTNSVKNQGYNELNRNSNLVASYIDGEYQNEIPGKNDGYIVDKIVCDNGAVATWDNEEWGINIRNATKKIKCSLYFVFKTEYDFDYTGNEQIFTVPKTGTYKLETWGAQGGGWYNSSASIDGGVGGYSTGFIFLNKNDILYVRIGKSSENYHKESHAPAGGGATSIKNSLLDDGTLTNYKNDIDKIIIVSGGGGGSEWTTGQGGAGGGFIGGSGLRGSAINAEGGTQLSGGKTVAYENNSNPSEHFDGSFGQGGYTIGDDGGGQGGNRFYGGGASDYTYGGGGGSGYIGNSLLTNKAMYCYNCEESSEENTKTVSTTCAEETPTENCAKKGNGYARITYTGD